MSFRKPVKPHFLGLWNAEQNEACQMGFLFPTVGANCVRSPNCHSEPFGEESRFVYFYFAPLEILRFAQDDKLGFVGINLCGRAGACPRRGVCCEVRNGQTVMRA